MQTHTKRILSRKDTIKICLNFEEKKTRRKKRKKTRETIVKLIAFQVNTKNIFLGKGYYRDLSQFPKEKKREGKKEKERQLQSLLGFMQAKKIFFSEKDTIKTCLNFDQTVPPLMLLQNMNIQYIYKECISLPEIRKTCQVSNIPPN